jgi:SAM-dependent methyltransferase
MEKSRTLSLALAAIFVVFSVSAEDVHPITHRKIAHVMSADGADWLVRPERESEEHPDQALDAIGIAPGSAIGDVGAGVGYFSWRMAERVGPSGVVYAEDIQPEMLEKLKQNMRERHIRNVREVLGKTDDPKLPANSLDVVLLVDVYHEFSEPEKMLDHIRDALKANGRLIFLEYRAEDPKVPIRPEHKMTIEQVKAEAQPEGFRFDHAIEVLPEQHIIVFRK